MWNKQVFDFILKKKPPINYYTLRELSERKENLHLDLLQQ